MTHVSTHLTGQTEREIRGLPGAPTFEYRDGVLCCEEVPIERIHRAVGACYVYSTERLRENARRVLKAFSRANTLLCFATKANTNPALFRLFHEFGLGLEVSSGAEFRTWSPPTSTRFRVSASVGLNSGAETASNWPETGTDVKGSPSP